MRGGWGRLAPLVAALTAAACTTGVLPAAGVADSAPKERLAALRQSEHQALLALYAAEATLGRAQAELERLEEHSAALVQEEAAVRRRAAIARRSVTASQRRVAEMLRALYVDGDTDPMAVVLGARSLDEMLTGIESLERATAQNRRLVSEAQNRRRELETLRERLGQRRAALEAARADAVAAAARLAGAATERRQTLAGIRRESNLTARRIAELEAQARAAERASARITRAAVAAPPSSAPARPVTTETTPAQTAETVDSEGEHAADAGTSAPAEPVPPPAGTRTMVVEAVAYHLPGRTASGLPVGIGIVAVDPHVIPLGTRMFIPGYGPGVAADVGSAVKGNVIDLWMPSREAALSWGRRTVTITIYG